MSIKLATCPIYLSLIDIFSNAYCTLPIMFDDFSMAKPLLIINSQDYANLFVHPKIIF